MATIFSNIKERVLYISENKGITREKFFDDLGITYGNFKGKAKEKALSSDVLAKIITKYPDVNPEWLLTGKGSMLKDEAIKGTPVEVVAPIKVEGKSLMPKVIVLKDEDDEKERIPLVPIMAQAGYLKGYDDPKYIRKLPMYNLPGMRNGTFRMFQVEGLSMYPTLQSGSYVVGQFVEDWQHISDNRIYVVVSKEGVIVKRVLNRIEKYGSLYCRSDNRVFPHINVDLKDVREVWECKMHLSFEFLDPIPEYQKIADLQADMHFLKQRVEQLEEEKTEVL